MPPSQRSNNDGGYPFSLAHNCLPVGASNQLSLPQSIDIESPRLTMDVLIARLSQLQASNKACSHPSRNAGVTVFRLGALLKTLDSVVSLISDDENL